MIEERSCPLAGCPVRGSWDVTGVLVHFGMAHSETSVPQEFVDVHFKLCRLVERKDKIYRGAWRRVGWAGNVSRILSKAAEIKGTMHRLDPLPNREEVLLDLIAHSYFCLINYEAKNRYGEVDDRRS